MATLRVVMWCTRGVLDGYKDDVVWCRPFSFLSVIGLGDLDTVLA